MKIPMGSGGLITDKGKKKCLAKNITQCDLVHHRFHKKCSGIEHEYPR